MGLRDFSAADLEAIRLLLKGSSVIDWHQLAFTNREQVISFLRVNEFNFEDPQDMLQLERIRVEAVEYLTNYLGYNIPIEIATDVPAHELFLIASRKEKFQSYACVVLKTMHVIHHLNGREILFKLPISNDQIFSIVEEKVLQIIDKLRSAHCPIVEFAWSRKEKSSLITKLLAKRESIAAHVYDKLRFRLVVQKYTDLTDVLLELTKRLIPFNYIIPGQTVNKLLPFETALSQINSLQKNIPALQELSAQDSYEEANRFSSQGYRVLNFVADLPIRVSSILKHFPLPSLSSITDVDRNAIVFVLTEFQILDAQTERDNELEENNHQAYKERQRNLVKSRLTLGQKPRTTP